MKRNIKKALFISISAVMLLFGSPYNIVYPQIISKDLPNREGFKFDKVKRILLHAAFKTGVDFDGNIFLSDRDEEYDSIVLLNPSIGVEIPFKENIFALEYDAMQSYFLKHRAQDHLDHRALGLLEINWTDYKITFDNTYRRFTNRAGQDETGATGTRTREGNNKFNAGIKASFDKLQYEVGYKNNIKKYIDGRDQPLFGPLTYHDRDNMYNILSGEIDYRFFTKTSLLLEGNIGHINYPNNLVPDSNYYELLPGIKARWHEKWVVDLRGGYRIQDYKSSNFVHNGDINSFVGKGTVEYYLREDKDIFRLSLERSFRESIYADINYHELGFAGLDYTHRFTRKISGILYGTWQGNRYPYETTEDDQTHKRKDHIYEIGAKLRYDLRNWISFEAGYEYGKRNSNFATFDYVDHLGSIRGTIGF